MRKILTTLIGCLLVATASAQEFKGACLKMPEPNYDFGDIARKGGDLVREFPYTNVGSAPLVVLRVLTSCSCLRADFSKRPLAPGASAVIRITYEPHKREPGSFNKVIQIYSNSEDGRHVITVRGNSMEKENYEKIKAEKSKKGTKDAKIRREKR